jgi:hypothetical protein
VASATNHGSKPTVEDMREYLLAELNSSLRRPEMYGGQVSHETYLDALGFLDSIPRFMHDEIGSLRSRGAFHSTGVRGAFEDIWGTAIEDMIASVYAEISRRHHWLRLDRTLSQDEYHEMLRIGRYWCEQDRNLSEVIEVFGSPSIRFGGSNPRFPKTLAYMTEQSEEPALSFHFWNRRDPGRKEADYVEPMLLAVRREGGRFADSFSFTPIGRRHRKAAESRD